MLDAFIIDKMKREKRREQRREIRLPLYIEEPLDEEQIRHKNEKTEKDKYYERIDIETE